MLGLILSGYFIAILILLLARFLNIKFINFVALFPALLTVIFVSFLPQVMNGQVIKFTTEWIPSLGINLDFKIDGLSLLFAIMVSSIGTLVYLYASKYLRGHKYIDRFFCYITLFMSSMLGVVLSDNLIGMFIFWELTSISSFFLIGFNNTEEKSRKNALTALGITGLGGFMLLSGFLLLGNITGTYNISDINNSYDFIHNSFAYPFLIVLICLGAFTKSAQFPFHVWLPGAMSAPTPVSAYLHSATMVKAGVFLLARLSPALGNHPMWNYTLMAVGAVTMLYAAVNSLYKTDLKGILAYTTIAALGMIVMLLGIGNGYAFQAAIVFILVHAFYKASLFMLVGVIDHEAHTRDVTKLAGLRKVLPIVAVTGFFAAFSNAGIPLTFGFIGKDLIYESTLHHYNVWVSYILTGVALFTNIILLYAGFQVGIKPFLGTLPDKFQKIKMPNWRLFIPPLLLAIAGIFYGLFPQTIDVIIVRPAFNAVTKGLYDFAPLKIWHGFNIVLILSLSTILLGLLIYKIRPVSIKKEEFVNYLGSFGPKKWLDSFVKQIEIGALKVTRTLHNGYLRKYLRTIIVFFILIVGYKFFTEVPFEFENVKLSNVRLYELVVFCIMVITILLTVTTTSRITAIVSLSIIGYAICLLYVFYGAPDLAMTQFIIDTLTVVLFVLVLFKLPSFLKFNDHKTQFVDAIISISFGVLIAMITFEALLAPAEKNVSKFYAENAYLIGKGKNVVNVILVDFRGFDTMIETIVLSIAAIGVYSLLKLQIKSSEKE